MAYQLINGAEINGVESTGGSGHTSTVHGIPTVTVILHAGGHLATRHGNTVVELGYDAVLRPTGARGTRHGVPTIAHAPVTIGTVVLQAASS